MTTEPNRSEQVIEHYRQRKLARSALCRIQDLIRQFEAEHAFDRRAARVGVIALVLLVAVSLYFLFSGTSITLN